MNFEALKAECDAVWFVTWDVFKYASRAGVREKRRSTACDTAT
jgi:hypothetical protein